MKWSLYMASNHQNLTIRSIRLKSDNWVAKISLTTGLGSDPAPCTLDIAVGHRVGHSMHPARESLFSIEECQDG